MDSPFEVPTASLNSLTFARSENTCSIECHHYGAHVDLIHALVTCPKAKEIYANTNFGDLVGSCGGNTLSDLLIFV